MLLLVSPSDVAGVAPVRVQVTGQPFVANLTLPPGVGPFPIEKLLPAPEEAAAVTPHPGYKADEIVMDRAGRGRALLFIGLTLPLLYLGYTWISGRDISFLRLPTIEATLVCLGGATWLSRARRGVREKWGSRTARLCENGASTHMEAPCNAIFSPSSHSQRSRAWPAQRRFSPPFT